MSIRIEGMDRLIKKLNRLGGDVQGCMYRGIGEGMTAIEGDAKDLCPEAIVRGGELRDSIHSDTKKTQEGIQGTCGTNKEYAAYVEYGTGQRGSQSPSPPKGPIGDGYREDWAGMSAQPYLYPALMQNKDIVKELCVEELNQEIRRLGGS